VAEPGVVYFVDKPGAVQSVLSIGRRWVDRSDPRYFANLLGNRILGGDFLSRLNQNLREKNGFTYGAGSVFRYRRSGSVWLVSTQVRADATAPALKEALGELDALSGGRPFTAEEVTTAIDAESRSYPETFESPGAITGILAEMARFRLPPEYLDTFLDRLQATKSEAVVRAMAEVVVPRERVVLVVGDRKAVEPRLRELGYTKIRPVTPDGVPADHREGAQAAP
jgi:zinc protease